MDGTTLTRTKPFLNHHRLHVQGTVLALCLWGTYAWIMATPGVLDRNGLVKGTDFLHYYTLGSLALEHRGGDLYDMAAQSEVAQQRVPQAGRLYFVPLYGPQVSLLFAPLAKLSYGWALTVWLVANGLIYALCCYAVWRTCPNLRQDGALTCLLALAYPPLFHLLAWGQTSALALACFTAAYLALRSEHKFAPGLAIGCLFLKPQLGLAAAFVFVLAGEWMVVVGAMLAALAQLSAGWAYYGTAVMRDYVWRLTHVRNVLPLLEPRPYQTHSLWSFWGMLLPWPSVAFWLYTACALAVLGVALACWRTRTQLNLRFAALLIATVLVSPHLTVYDLVVLAPMFLLLADWLRSTSVPLSSGKPGMLLYGCYVLPLTGPLARWTHVQLTIPVLVALLWVIYRWAARRGDGRSRATWSPAAPQ